MKRTLRRTNKNPVLLLKLTQKEIKIKNKPSLKSNK